MDCLFGGNSSSRSGIYNKDAINYYTTHLIEMSTLTNSIITTIILHQIHLGLMYEQYESA